MALDKPQGHSLSQNGPGVSPNDLVQFEDAGGSGHDAQSRGITTAADGKLNLRCLVVNTRAFPGEK